MSVGDRGAAHMLMSLLQPQQMLAIGFGEATMNTLQRLGGLFRHSLIRLVTLSVASVLI